jgi:hypothetical protein
MGCYGGNKEQSCRNSRPTNYLIRERPKSRRPFIHVQTKACLLYGTDSPGPGMTPSLPVELGLNSTPSPKALPPSAACGNSPRSAITYLEKKVDYLVYMYLCTQMAWEAHKSDVLRTPQFLFLLCPFFFLSSPLKQAISSGLDRARFPLVSLVIAGPPRSSGSLAAAGRKGPAPRRKASRRFHRVSEGGRGNRGAQTSLSRPGVSR